MRCALAFFVAALWAHYAQATVLTGSVTGGAAHQAGGVFVKLYTPLANPHGNPNSVGDDNFQSPNLFAFDEVQNLALSAELNVSLRAGGGDAPLPVGTTVSSHYVVYDPPDQQNMDLMGTIEFDADVLAIIWGSVVLNGSDFLKTGGVNFEKPDLRGKEPRDMIRIAESNPRQVTVNLHAGSPGDSFRVLTGYSPSGDYDADDDADGADFLVWQRQFGELGDNLEADGDLDGDVDGVDLRIWADHFGTQRPAGSQPASAMAPEPNGLELAALAMAAGWANARPAAGRRRRARRR